MVAKHLEIDLLQQTDTVIYFEWSDTGDTCVVKRDADTIYTGNENSLKDENLQIGELYTYTIERLGNDGEVKERIKMQTSTEDHSEDTVNYLQQIAITTIVSESKIILAWGAIDGIDEYEIYRDGEPMETTQKTQFTDFDVEMDREYSYWIRAERPLERSETGFSEEKSVAARIFGLLNIKSSQQEAAMEKFWIAKKIAPLEQLLADAPQVNVSEFKRTWDLRYTTFLPDEYLANPNLLSPNRYFAGDNRTFTPESSHYRTQVNFSLQLGNEETTLEFQKDVGPSIAYDWRKKFRKADVASSEGIQLEKAKEDDRNVMVNLTHSVGNPLTTSPNIDYDVSATFYRDGHYDITGLHDQAPNHEVYLKNDKMDDWFQIHEAESKGLAWMSRSTASQYWRISNFE
ncbi:DUF3238 domain-containing protein [Planococcus liqunii]|uniref:DUF3238 domain-containing protein n=1 Tax=Planococcus liqunii TaxID=3058394 RepID=A0ABT8MV77_9BACL|nr:MULTISPECIES: DUF3238 domain-containing protein [unclassified Planococcus (in: firmicutes)]MDN7228828.1 DUF3238 domain-containing protein [Planococcus sp. N064]WKA51260.1 DUF3238 domain-containing protein [Planococcus sp. N056]